MPPKPGAKSKRPPQTVSTAAHVVSARRWLAPGWVVFLCAAGAYAYFLHALPFTNAETRWALVRAIVEQHSLSIDAYHAPIGDKALIDGHYYTDKAPGSSLLGVPFYAVLYYAGRITGMTLSDAAEREIVRYFVVSLPAAGLAWLLFHAVRVAGCPTFWAGVLALAYALGTPAFPYSTLYYGHSPAALCVFAAFYLIAMPRGRIDEPVASPTTSQAWLAGLLAGLAILIEHPIVVLVAPLGLYVLFAVRPFSRTILFGAAIVPGVLITLAYNGAITGDPLTFPYKFEATEAYRAEMAAGLYSVTHPKITALWDLTFSLSRGIFVYSPFLLFAVAGVYLAARCAPRLRPVLLAGTIGAVMIVFNASIDSPWGGWSCGPRYLIPGLPFLAFACYVPLLPTRGWWWRPLFAGLVFVSVARFLWATSVTPHLPEAIENPVTEFWWPLAQAGVTTPSFGTWLGLASAWSLLPLVAWIGLAILLLARARETAAPTHVAMSWQGVGVALAAIAGFALLSLWPTEESIMKYTVRAVTFQMNGAPEEAQRDYTRLLELYQGEEEHRRNALEAHVRLGEHARSAGDFQVAEEHYRAGIALVPQFPNPRFALAIVLEAQQRPLEAVESYRAAYELDPRRVDIGQRLAWLLATHPDAEVREGAEALEVAQALCAATQQSDPRLLDALAAALAETGDYAGAITQAGLAIRLANQRGDVNLARAIHARRQLYERGQPYHGG
ncbi:MAG: hypothetical protein KF708_03940 [Pirellulales bacterium]|nr:hypothetical protein [Pirellulales bacterium]